VKASGEVSTVIVIAEYFVAFYSTHNDMMNEIGDIESRESWHVMKHSLYCKDNQARTSLFTSKNVPPLLILLLLWFSELHSKSPFG
jgi:hypothetical protein